MPSAKKIEDVKELNDKVARAKSFFFTEYKGLTHQQLETLRKALKKVQAEYIVAKNTLLSIALKNNNTPDADKLDAELKNPTATLFAFGDDIAAIKELSKFVKAVQLPKIKAGIFGGKMATAADFQKLANVPSREVLLATLLIRIQSPLYGLHYGLNWNLSKLVVSLNNVKSKKPASN